MASGRFSRLVICVPEGADPETEAARIAAAGDHPLGAGQLAPRLALGPAPQPHTGPTSTQAGKAVAVAYAQLGKPYQRGATGPGSSSPATLATICASQIGSRERP